MNKRLIGSDYEARAASHLEALGYEIIEKNYRDQHGEIDLIAKDGNYLVFIEVKYRKNGKMGDPAEAVTWQKQKTIRHTARYYMLTHGLGSDTACRFDVVAILGEDIRVLQDAF